MTTWERENKSEPENESKRKKDQKILAFEYDTKVPNLKVILKNLIISSAEKIGRPILVNLPTYYVRFSSDPAQPTYLPT